jgi:sugar phosphate isomerase/epimerase
MKIGLLGLISSDLSDVDYNMLRFAADLGFHGLGAHLNVPAETISDETVSNVKAVFADQNMPLLQLWGPYPCIISPDEHVRQAGVKGAQAIVKLAAKLGTSASGVRPTSLNPNGNWWPHPDNYAPETEDRLVKSLKEILQTADDYGIDIVLETHVTTTLDTPQTIKRVIERTESSRLKVNIDPVNFMGDLRTACDPAPKINEVFDILGPYADSVHVKDFYFEDRLTVHITETVIGTGMMDLDTVLRRSAEVLPEGYVVIEHLPLSLVPLAKRNLTAKIQALGIPLG